MERVKLIHYMKINILACINLHNVCIEEGDNIPYKLDLAFEEG